ncbi:uncharacterized protein LOC125954559 [Anopheles darlingi]|uniref:uncharacterized protein LOC125954559 n=1 Tax=Anopheles darlingi TaxID=43151 RepID=UPI0021004EC2|nr:uncharacterized protein LOC125954559 [Anopheles darlingi]
MYSKEISLCLKKYPCHTGNPTNRSIDKKSTDKSIDRLSKFGNTVYPVSGFYFISTARFVLLCCFGVLLWCAAFFCGKKWKLQLCEQKDYEDVLLEDNSVNQAPPPDQAGPSHSDQAGPRHSDQAGLPPTPPTGYTTTSRRRTRRAGRRARREREAKRRLAHRAHMAYLDMVAMVRNAQRYAMRGFRACGRGRGRGRGRGGA